MKILLTGKDTFTYNRTVVLLNGLKALGVELIYFPISKKKNFDKKQFTPPKSGSRSGLHPAVPAQRCEIYQIHFTGPGSL